MIEYKLKDAKLFRQQCYINGEWIDSARGASLKVTNPATGTLLGTVPALGADETRAAVDAASLALPDWQAKTAQQRAEVLHKWHDLLLEHQQDLALVVR